MQKSVKNTVRSVMLQYFETSCLNFHGGISFLFRFLLLSEMAQKQMLKSQKDGKDVSRVLYSYLSFIYRVFIKYCVFFQKI